MLTIKGLQTVLRLTSSAAIVSLQSHQQPPPPRGLARDFGPRAITVNVVQFGPIDTDAKPAVGPMKDLLHSFMTMKRHGHPDEVANMVIWLASEQASFVTGSLHTIDGAFGA